MIISTLILTVCILVVLFELLSMLMIFRSCRNIRCTAVSSEKICEREDGYLIREYWNTGVTFELDGTTRSASLETSTFCQKGQVLSEEYTDTGTVVECLLDSTLSQRVEKALMNGTVERL